MNENNKLSLLKLIDLDWKCSKGNIKSHIFVTAFRLAYWCNAWRYKSTLLWILFVPYLILYRVFFEWGLGIELPHKTSVGHSFRIDHGYGLVINDQCKIGSNVILRHCTTIGNLGRSGKCPIIGNNVNVGSNVVIIGGVTIGDNCIIGAGTVVVKDVAANSVVVGNPARVIRSI